MFDIKHHRGSVSQPPSELRHYNVTIKT